MSTSWILYLNRGKTFLARHDTRSAVNCFERALHHCPVEETMALSSILYLCGFALKKLGQNDSARECWRSSAGLRPEGPAAYMLKTQRYPEDFEWYQFKAVQLAMYFVYKQKGSFFSEEEREKVELIIRTYWEELIASGILEDLNADERVGFYAELCIDFGRILCSPSSADSPVIIPFKTQGKNSDTLNLRNKTESGTF